MPSRVSAVDAVSPAFDRTKRQLFSPFRFGHWARLAVVSLLTGEFAGGGSTGGGNFSIPQGGGGDGPGKQFLWLARSDWNELLKYLPWIVAGILVLVALGLVWTYVACVYRFILFDAVLSNRCELRAGWRRWQRQGSSYFLWEIGFGLAVLAGLALLVSVPVFLAWRSGLFRRPDAHIAALVLGGLAVLFGFIGVILLGVFVNLFAKDFVVPYMALENTGIFEGWRRFLPTLRAEKLAYAGYILMKIVLWVGSAILFGILNFLVVLGLLVPLGIAAAVLFAVGKGGGLTWNFYTVSTVVVLGAGALFLILYTMCFVSVPAAVFFQAYPLHFLGSRYAALDVRLNPPPPPITSPPPPAPLPTPSPAA